jgi:hypothetical protein
MRVWLATVLVSFGLLAALAPALAQPWPPLPATGFTKGRPATDEDVAAGNAVFVLKQYGKYFGKPLDIAIPQYAYLIQKGDKPVPVIVIQAEQERNLKLFGVRGLDGETLTVKEPELQLLGANPPQ